MTRLDKIIKGFNDYDNLIKELISWLEDNNLDHDAIVAEFRVDEIRKEVSSLIGELKRFGCAKEKQIK
jgi:hypothetical protein